MAEGMILTAVGLPLIVGLVASAIVERWLTPHPKTLCERTLQAGCLHCGSWLMLFTLLLVLSQRPWFSMGLVLAFQLLLILVNNVKYSSLKEPLLVQDFEYFRAVLKHPGLYVPFFGFWRTLLASTGAIALVTAGLMLESPLLDLFVPSQVWGLGGGLALISGLLLFSGPQTPLATSFDPERDFKELGPIACFWVYGRALLRQPAIAPEAGPFNGAPDPVEAAALPNLVVVQSESFFDPRALSPLIRNTLLENYDQIVEQSMLHGRLEVPAWGANTLRTECGFLTGLSPSALGIHAFNPYRHLAKAPIPNLAAHLSMLGYRTLCIHPYPASFYLRNQVYPRLGFDKFIDIDHFSEDQKQGHYIGDAAVAEKVAESLAQPSDKPLFVFVITMENHGPFHLEVPDSSVVERFCRQPLPADCGDLAVYLGHIRSADRMIGSLVRSLDEQPRDGMLCWYGDHMPIMPSVYRSMTPVDSRTEYLIWRSGVQGPGLQDLSVDQLAEKLLELLIP